MYEFEAENEPASSLQLVSLGQLCNLGHEDRCERLLNHDHEGFESALQTLDRAGIAAKMNAQRLAWAVAFNIGGVTLLGACDQGSRTIRRGYLDHWHSEVKWPEVWSVLIKPLSVDGFAQPSSLLSELALSVACEQREDWQNPSARPIDSATANRIFEFVYAENKLKVLGMCRRFAGRAGDLEAIANEAWSRVFCDYWSAHATRRFHGLSRISTLVCQVARFIAIDSIREQTRFVLHDEDLRDDKPSSSASDSVTARVLSEQLYRRAQECMTHLPAKRRIVAEMVWFRQINANRVAQLLSVSESAISQHLKKARELVGICLKEHGFDVPQ